jgi:hypothetical protein
VFIPIICVIGGENYFIEMSYFGDTTLVVRAMPRLQNQWTLVAVNVVDGTTRNIRTQTHPQWLEPSGNLLILLPLRPPIPSRGCLLVSGGIGMLTYIGNNQFVDLIVVNNWNHLVVFDATTGKPYSSLKCMPLSLSYCD